MSSVTALEFDNFTFAYPQAEGQQASASSCELSASANHRALGSLDPLSARVEQGGFLLLSGATGSGKTTLLRCCTHALAPMGTLSGSIRVFGTPVDNLDAVASAQTVGYVAQNPQSHLVCDTVWRELAFGLENLGVPAPEMRKRVAEVAHFFGIEPWFLQETAQLSGGQQQMVLLASVLALHPRLLLLDEPTAQLDPIAEKQFLHALFRVNRELGITVVMATHATFAAAAYATAFWELRDGTVHERSLEQLQQTSGPFATHTEAAHPTAASAASARNEAPTACATDAANHTMVAPNTSTPADASPCIKVSKAYVGYPASDFVLRGASLEVVRGSIHALLGGNACGKTTLLHAVAGVLKPVRGKIENHLRESQALLPQNPCVLFVCDTVAEELMEWSSSAGYSYQHALDLAKQLGLHTHMQQHPYDLSEGQQQLLALAKLVLTRPKLLLLDEPTKGLDLSTRVTLARLLLQQQAQGTTILLASHDLSFVAALTQQVTLLFDGQDACTESAECFFAENLFYRVPNDGFLRALNEARSHAPSPTRLARRPPFSQELL